MMIFYDDLDADAICDDDDDDDSKDGHSYISCQCDMSRIYWAR